jgi:hypothetical protein
MAKTYSYIEIEENTAGGPKQKIKAKFYGLDNPSTPAQGNGWKQLPPKGVPQDWTPDDVVLMGTASPICFYYRGRLYCI